VLARKPHAPWYAGGRWVPPGAANDLAALGARAREAKATHLFVSWPEVQMRPGLAFLLLPEFAPPGLSPVAASRDGWAVLYAVGESLGVVLPPWYPEEAEWRSAEAAWLFDPENREALRLAARGRHATGSYARAEVLYRELAARQSDDSRVLVELGKVLLLQGKVRPALRLYETLVARAPDDPDAWRGLAEASFRAGDRRRAAQALEGYLARHPDPEAARVLERLRATEAAPGR
jgi:tetratricopeptide (TPR) repeat protein